MNAGESRTFRRFILGAGFAKHAGFPLASELLPMLKDVAASCLALDGYSHLEHALEQYEQYLEDVDPTRPFDLEAFGAWLDWEHTLRLKGSDTFSEYGNEAGLQLRWAIGRVLYASMPSEIPQLYLDFARGLTVTDRILTLNYDLLLERALDSIGLPYRRYPTRFSEIYDTYSVADDSADELVILKLHGSLDWTYVPNDDRDDSLGVRPLVEGPRQADDPLLSIGEIPAESLSCYYSGQRHWYASPTLLMPPSTAKPMAGSPLVPLWNGVGLYAYPMGGLTIIGCSLSPGDPYVLQLAHHMATDYAVNRGERGVSWPQHRMKVVGRCSNRVERHQFLQRFRFMSSEDTDFILDGFEPETLSRIFND